MLLFNGGACGLWIVSGYPGDIKISLERTLGCIGRGVTTSFL